MRTRSSPSAIAVVLLLLLPNAVFVSGFTQVGSPIAKTRTSAVLTKRQHPSPPCTSLPTPTASSAYTSALFSPSALSVGSSIAANGDSTNAESNSSGLSVKEQKEQERVAQIKREGGLFSFKTKVGLLNPYAIYYGTVAVLLGIPWFIALTLYQLFAFVTRGKVDKLRLIPVLVTHVWGTLLLRLTRSFPTIVNKQIAQDFYKQKRPAMFVANHCSWMDIPYMGVVIGWRNYKMIAKQELRRVPILGKAIAVGGNVMVDRTNRRSQLKTLKDGIQYLKDGVHLCTFPEGTRSRNGQLKDFKNGAFKMAQKAGAPVVPLSICNAHKVNPPTWVFPFRASYNVAKVVVHEPIESVGKTEEELAEAVREAMISGLPDDQKPAPKKVKPTPKPAPVPEPTPSKMEASTITTTTTTTTNDSTTETPTAPKPEIETTSTDKEPPLGTVHVEKVNLEKASATTTSEPQTEEKTA